MVFDISQCKGSFMNVVSKFTVIYNVHLYNLIKTTLELTIYVIMDILTESRL